MAGQSLVAPETGAVERRLDGFGEGERPGGGVFDGVLTALKLRRGFGLHTLNATARRAFEVQSQRNPGVVLHCFLEGATEAHLDGKPMNLGRRPGEPVKIVMTSVGEVQRFARWSQPNDYVRKISVQMSPEWLDENGLSLPPQQRIEWVAGHEDVQVMEQLARASGFANPAARLQAEAMSLGLVARSFAYLAEPVARGGLTSREQAQLHRINEYAQQPGPLPSLAELATVGGVSLSGLRRLIRAAHGCAPLAHVRGLRLGMARTALEEGRLSVEEAAELAGYSSAANFATAFRRAFDVAPSQVRRAVRPH